LPGLGEEVAYLGLGGNIGDPRTAMVKALRAIDADRMTEITNVSSLYSTPPWGKLDQPPFLNAVAEVRTQRSPKALLDLCLDTEIQLKRVRGERFGPRLIDIDVLLYGTRSVKELGLEIPHPRMFLRAFVLVPLAEIAPDLTIRNEPSYRPRCERHRKTDRRWVLVEGVTIRRRPSPQARHLSASGPSQSRGPSGGRP
jgi:2-amino-4-hydroxy-6-hydroxymethyldihydropteridine diphosphokinase